MGTLYLVATPIGNLEDITLRALRILREVPLIAAEDTRHTRKLLTHYEISTPLTSYHEHSGPARHARVLEALASGDVALVSDAGTPALSDPGQDLVRDAVAAGYPVVPIPGPVAAVSALVASGLPTDSFVFLGFAPRRPKERRALLEQVRDEPRTLIFYEAPHRLEDLLADAQLVLGERMAVLARELTKVHEEWRRGLLADVRAGIAAAPASPRGEFTVLIAGDTTAGQTAISAEERARVGRDLIRAALLDGASTREAAQRTAKQTGMARRDAYRMALDLAREQPDLQQARPET